jgi:Protein of unknown function (DUF2806)
MILVEGINFGHLKLLDSIGLISFEAVEGYVRSETPKYRTIFYYGRPLIIEFPEDSNQFETGKVMLTSAGKQLAIVLGSKPTENYYQETVEKFVSKGYILSSSIGKKAF